VILAPQLIWHQHFIGSSARTLTDDSIKAPFIVPFRRDAEFIARGDIFDRIHEKLEKPASRVALSGLGGVGYVFLHGVTSIVLQTLTLWQEISARHRVCLPNSRVFTRDIDLLGPCRGPSAV
jgi:hypothetical protein